MKRFLMTVLALPLLCLMPAAGTSAGPGSASLLGLQHVPRVGERAPAFKLADASGRHRSLAEFRGRPVALFVFCGCSWCAAVAREWATAQRSASLSGPAASSGAERPVTVVVGSGMEAKGCRALAARAGLDLAQTILLPDPDHSVAEAYHADPCPRVFVIGADGTIRYVNRGQADAPRKAPAPAIVAHALAALRAEGP
jgi:peroxiredoxin